MKDAYYFPHFSNARSDEKIIKVRRVFGMEGYGLYFAILEALREKKDFILPLSSLEDFAYDWHVSKEKLYSIVADFDLFKIQEDCFFSPKLIEFLEPYLEGKERKRIGGIKGNLIKSGIITKTQASKMTAEELDLIDQKRKEGTLCLSSLTEQDTSSHRESLSEQDTERLPSRSASQKKGNEKKGNEKKGNEKKGNENIDNSDEFFFTYPNPNGSLQRVDKNFFTDRFQMKIDAVRKTYKLYDDEKFDELFEDFFIKYALFPFNDQGHVFNVFNKFFEGHRKISTDSTIYDCYDTSKWTIERDPVESRGDNKMFKAWVKWKADEQLRMYNESKLNN